MVEDVEEGVLRLLQSNHLLYVVNYQHINALIEMHEVIEGVVADRVCELNLEEVGTQVEHTLLGMQFFQAGTDGVHQVSLAYTAGSIYK